MQNPAVSLSCFTQNFKTSVQLTNDLYANDISLELMQLIWVSEGYASSVGCLTTQATATDV